MKKLKKEIRKRLENITTYDHKLIVSELEKIDYDNFGLSEFDVVCDDRNNNPYTINYHINVDVMTRKKINSGHIVFTMTILKNENIQRIINLKKSRIEKLNNLNGHH